MRFHQRISEIKEALEELETIISLGEDSFLRSRTARFSARYSIVQIVEATADLGLFILERKFDESPKGYRDVFRRLALRGIVSSSTAEEMEKLASLRNMVVHRYWDVDDRRIYREAKSGGLEAVKRFLSEVIEYESEEG